MRAHYTYKLKTYKDKLVISIRDLGTGKSVTNDIENVIDDIARMESIAPKDCIIVYEDSYGGWDGWDANTESFVVMSEDSEYEAIKNYEKSK